MDIETGQNSITKNVSKCNSIEATEEEGFFFIDLFFIDLFEDNLFICNFYQTLGVVVDGKWMQFPSFTALRFSFIPSFLYLLRLTHKLLATTDYKTLELKEKLLLPLIDFL